MTPAWWLWFGSDGTANAVRGDQPHPRSAIPLWDRAALERAIAEAKADGKQG